MTKDKVESRKWSQELYAIAHCASESDMAHKLTLFLQEFANDLLAARPSVPEQGRASDTKLLKSVAGELADEAECDCSQVPCKLAGTFFFTLQALRDTLYERWLAASRSEAQPSQEWNLITSAPKDGTHILASEGATGRGFGVCGGRTQPFAAVVHWWDGDDAGWYLSSGSTDQPLTGLVRWKYFDRDAGAPAAGAQPDDEDAIHVLALACQELGVEPPTSSEKFFGAIRELKSRAAGSAERVRSAAELAVKAMRRAHQDNPEAVLGMSLQKLESALAGTHTEVEKEPHG